MIIFEESGELCFFGGSS